MHENVKQHHGAGFSVRVLGMVFLAIVVLLLGYGLGLELHRFGYGGWVVWIFATLVFPLLVGLVTPAAIFNRRISVALTAYLIALAFSTGMDVGISKHAYEFRVRHGTPHDAAIKRPIDYWLWMTSALFSVSAPVLVVAKSVSKIEDKDK